MTTNRQYRLAARPSGLVAFDYVDRYPQAMQEMVAWIAAGKLQTREDIVNGIENFPDALLELFKGENFGKWVLKVTDA